MKLFLNIFALLSYVNVCAAADAVSISIRVLAISSVRFVQFRSVFFFKLKSANRRCRCKLLLAAGVGEVIMYNIYTAESFLK